MGVAISLPSIVPLTFQENTTLYPTNAYPVKAFPSRRNGEVGGTQRLEYFRALAGSCSCHPPGSEGLAISGPDTVNPSKFTHTMAAPTILTALEFYSGIGGWSSAASLCGASLGSCGESGDVSIQVLAAFDINPAANQVYEANYNLKPVHRSLEHISCRELQKYRAKIWMMSPPCQPFTRNNDTATRDKVDPRSASFLHLQQILQEMESPPDLLFLENVVGFEVSDCCQDFLQVLSSRNFIITQFHLTPLQYGIPNDRPRYYCIARRQPNGVGFVDPVIHKCLPSSSNLSTEDNSSTTASAADLIRPSSLARYLEQGDFENLASYEVPSRVLTSSSGWCLDLRTAQSTYTACFTKSYTRFARGTGSVLLEIMSGSGVSRDVTVLTALEEFLDQSRQHTQTSSSNSHAQSSSFDKDWWPILQQRVAELLPGSEGQLRLRYFTPRELLALFGFPHETFVLLPETTLGRHKYYELIGNSVNVLVVSYLLAHGIQQQLEEHRSHALRENVESK